MSNPTPQNMPKGMLARACWAAVHTQEKRNRAVDFYRAVAVVLVVLGVAVATKSFRQVPGA